MKHLIINIVLAVALFANIALGAETQQKGDFLASQISVTRDAIQQVLAKMRNAPEQQVGSNPDFVAKANAFNADAERAMQKFEARLTEILKQATFYTDRLSAIKNSSAYSSSQKDALLRDQINVVKAVFTDLSAEYQKALLDLYTLDLNLPDIRLELADNGFDKVACGSDDYVKYVSVRLKSSDPRFQDKTVKAYDRHDVTSIEKFCHDGSLGLSDYYREKYKLRAVHTYFIKELHNIVFNDVVRKDCLSSSCLALYSSHRLSYIELIRHDIDEPITLNAVNTSFQLEALRSGYSSESVMDTGEWREYKSKLNPEFLRELVILNPGESAGMPFEVSEREFRIEKLKTALLNPPGSFFSSWECPAKAAEIKAEICQSAGGCLSTQEINSLTDTIRDADVYSKSARVECLNQR